MHPVSNLEWQVAEQQLLNAPDGTILPWSLELDNSPRIAKWNRAARGQLHHSYRTTHSFVKINGHIYALARGKRKDSVHGGGSNGVVKFAYDRQGEICLIKIGTSTLKEITTLQDLNISNGGTRRLDNDSKYYIHMKYLGKNLADCLGKKISSSMRLQLAIDLCLQVYRLQSGQISTTNQPYAHWDIKPENITIDNEGRIHLVDYGSAVTELDTPVSMHSGPDFYCPLYSLTLLPTKFDVIGLKRTLLLPSHFQGRYNVHKLKANDIDRWSLLTRQMVRRYNLEACIDSSISFDFNEDNTTVLSLAAILITKQLKIKIDWDELKNDEQLCKKLVELYQENLPAWKIKYIISLRHFGTIQGQTQGNNFQSVQQFTTLMTDLKAKKDLFQQNGDHKTCEAVNSIIEAIDSTLEQDYNNLNNLSNEQLDQFGKALHGLKKAHKPAIESHRGVMGFIDTILSVLASFVVFYPITYGYQKYNKIHCSFFKTETSGIVDGIDELLQSSSAVAA